MTRPVRSNGRRVSKAPKVFRGHEEKGGWIPKGPDLTSSNNYLRVPVSKPEKATVSR
jgi:hypothetical protein